MACAFSLGIWVRASGEIGKPLRFTYGMEALEAVRSVSSSFSLSRTSCIFSSSFCAVGAMFFLSRSWMFGMLSAIEIACIVHDLFLFRFDGAQKFGSHLSRSHAFGGTFVQANPAGVLKGRSDRKENGGKSEQQECTE